MGGTVIPPSAPICSYITPRLGSCQTTWVLPKGSPTTSGDLPAANLADSVNELQGGLLSWAKAVKTQLTAKAMTIVGQLNQAWSFMEVSHGTGFSRVLNEGLQNALNS